MDSDELDSLLLSSRILADIDECQDFISGGILVSNINGTIKKIFTSQQEINSYLFRAHGTDVREETFLKTFSFHSLRIFFAGFQFSR